MLDVRWDAPTPNPRTAFSQHARSTIQQRPTGPARIAAGTTGSVQPTPTMQHRHHRAAAIGASALLVLATACKDRSNANADSALARDLALAGQQTVQPTFQDTSLAPAPQRASVAPQTPPTERVRTRTAERPERRETPRPVATRPAPQPEAPRPEPRQVAEAPAPSPAPAAGQIGAGVGFGVTSGSQVCTNTNRPGDKLVATVDAPVTGTRGVTIPAGAQVVLEVASVNSGDNGSNADITFRVRSIVVDGVSHPVQADVTSNGQLERTKVAGDPNADKKKVIGGAIAGAVLGQIFGHSTKSTVIGAAAGGAAGAVAAHASQKYEACLPAGSPMRVTLSDALVL